MPTGINKMTLCMKASKELKAALILSGWYEGRKSEETIASLSYPIHQKAREFLLEFGDLAIGAGVGKTLLTYESYLNSLHEDQMPVPDMVPGGLVIIGRTEYWSDGTLWMDEEGQVYISDSYDQVGLVARDIISALEIMILRKLKISADNPRWNFD